MSDYRLDVKVRNNRILQKIESAGYSSVGEFCRLNNKKSWQSQIGGYVNLKETPLNAEGDFYPHVYEMCEILNCCPEDLFTETQLQTAIETNKRHIEIGEAEIQFALTNMSESKLLEHVLQKDERDSELLKTLDKLTPREAKVIKMRFGIDGFEPSTLEQVALTFGVNRERIRQIEAKALRKLRHPSRSEVLQDLMIEEV